MMMQQFELEQAITEGTRPLMDAVENNLGNLEESITGGVKQGTQKLVAAVEGLAEELRLANALRIMEIELMPEAKAKLGNASTILGKAKWLRSGMYR